jgi:glycerol uptake facilitator protein
MKRQDFGEYLAEALAVFIIISFGDSVAAMYTLYNPNPYQGS